jgi:hypothetical protein
VMSFHPKMSHCPLPFIFLAFSVEN